ncbi:uncharacterized protein LOC107366790 [Tetranychus urticae]|uniref:Uncharacterized protein n=1 Tax=Tetranychus urticae TaxID=32264 RepID=T1KRZ1_TETUR|nr:uncharacterized protein LOC107366790 [Tetranychus urticae]
MDHYLLCISIIWITTLISSGSAIRCYQCSSDENKTIDSCGAYESFDSNANPLVDCMSEDAVSSGTFCYKSIQQGPRGFIWDGRWRTVIRRCAQVTETGVNWGCAWGYRENGVYWEECYCAKDGCNAGNSLVIGKSMFLLTCLSTFTVLLLSIL